RWLYGSAARHVVTTGTRIRDELVQKGLVKSENCQSIHTGIDASIFSPGDRIDARRALSLNASGFYLGIAATIRSWKGHAYLIEALSTLPTHVELLIIGKGPYQETVESRVRDLGLENRVHFVGHQTRVAEWLRALDIFVLPSYANEGVPQSLMQAMLCRIPVVSTPVGSIEDIIRPESTGLLVPPKNSQALAQALDRLIRDDTLRDKLAEEGYRFALENCTLSSMVDQMEQVFQKVVSA
ncbi:MAG: glycosyltransferase family 1 protein, partial [Gammaproteobacteria bacterium]